MCWNGSSKAMWPAWAVTGYSTGSLSPCVCSYKAMVTEHALCLDTANSGRAGRGRRIMAASFRALLFLEPKAKSGPGITKYSSSLKQRCLLAVEVCMFYPQSVWPLGILNREGTRQAWLGLSYNIQDVFVFNLPLNILCRHYLEELFLAALFLSGQS